MTGEERTLFRGRMVNLHAESIAAMRDTLAELPWWAWRRRSNIRYQLALIAVDVIRDRPHVIEFRSPAPAGGHRCESPAACWADPECPVYSSSASRPARA